MITPAGTFEPSTPNYPPPIWDEEDKIEDPEEDRLPDEEPNPNPDENREVPVYFRLQ